MSIQTGYILAKPDDFSLYLQLHKQKRLQDGLAFLEGQERKEVESLSMEREERKEKELQEKRKALIEERLPENIFDCFSDSMIIGDSRALGFSEYGFLPADHVAARMGLIISQIGEYSEQVQKQQPRYLFIALGANDIESEIARREENGYEKALQENIQALIQKSPGSQIVINSIMICTPQIQQQDPLWLDTPEYNRQIEKTCSENNWIYIDNDSLAENGTGSIYEEDGIHFKPEAYPLWALNMLEGIELYNWKD